ncbi:MAG: cysteine desulfurase [Chloroflexi bacterium]|nr:MAG: cysteine desulfurase [Chloroflexota bacterium]MBL1196022.1 cysteine desulfurase [Chloroflexota bacterium]NOH13316.1 cysteine desulfurase [Chloroflexota bacterium]
MNGKKVYLDHAATTPLDPRVFAAMSPYFEEHYGNPSSVHTFGQKAEAAVESARETVAMILNCKPKEILFTSCGSESDNLALRGAALAQRETNNRKWVLVAPVEHHAVTHTAEQLAELHDFQLEWLPTDKFGRVTDKALQQAICDDTAIVSVMYANNEIGSINDLAALAELCRQKNIPFHSDAVQGAAYLSTNVQTLNVDLMALGAHKFYGPKGVGALYVREGMKLHPSQTGGGQEFGLRAGTHNVPYIVGFAEALRITQEEAEQHNTHMQALRDRIIDQVLETIPDSKLTGHRTERLPNHTSFVFKGVDGNALLMMLDVEGFACSSGSACKTGDPEPSDVLTSMGYDREWALGSLRITVGRHTTDEDVESFLNTLPVLMERSRTLEAV